MTFNLISTFLIAIALAMDAFSVSITKGFTQKHLKNSQIIYYGLFFGTGWYIGSEGTKAFMELIVSAIEWVIKKCLGEVDDEDYM